MQRLHAPAPGAKPSFQRVAAFSHRSISRCASIRSAHAAKAGVAPLQCSVLTSLKSRASVRSVASFLKSSARSHRSPRTCGGKAFDRAVTVQKLGGILGADGGDTEIGVAGLDHLEHGLQHADDSAVRAVHSFVEPAQPVEVTEELVGAVDEVNNHLSPTGYSMAELG